MNIKFRPSKKVSEFNPVPAMLAVKKLKRYNILVGEDFNQQKLAEEIVGVSCLFVGSLTDYDLQVDDTSKLFRVLSAKSVVLSPQVNDSTAFWSLDPIEKGSSGANALVRYAATLLGIDKPNKDHVERLADLLVTSGSVGDIRVALWASVAHLLDPPSLVDVGRWPQPWEDSILWFSIEGVSPEYRLNSLYNDMTAYCLIQDEEDSVLKKAGINMSSEKINFLKKLKLNYTKVHATIELLDSWRTNRTDPYICAFKISNVWAS